MRPDARYARLVRPLLALLLFSTACAGTSRGPALSTGDEDLDRTRSAVVFLSSDCSGVLIAPTLVLTAAHCVIGQAELPTVQVWRGNERWHTTATRCRMHPSAMQSGSERCDEPNGSTHQAHDLAVLALSAPVPDELATPLPVLLAPPVEGDADWWRGRRVRLVGWHRRPALIGDARRYSGENVIASVRGGVLTTVPVDPRFSTRIGASGGPALMEVDGREQVAGILFGGERADSSDSVYAATFYGDNASWLVRIAGEAFAPDMDSPDRPRFWQPRDPRAR